MIFTYTLAKGIIIALLYFETTKANDTTLLNTIIFTSFYMIMMTGAELLGMDSNVVTNAFITKTIFTLVDERIKKPEEPKS
jgi:hypothetical protein